MNRYTEMQKARFWSRVDLQGYNDCWPWKASTHTKGYGQVGLTVDGHFRMHRAHKVAYEIINDMMIRPWVHGLHSCDNPICCNPRHVFLGTNLDNMRDRDAKGRQARGSRVGTSKLTEAKVLRIREQLKTMSLAAIAAIHGVTNMSIYQIQQRQTWAWL